MLIIRRSKLYYAASGIVTPVGGRPVHRLRADSPLSTCATITLFVHNFNLKLLFYINYINRFLFILHLEKLKS